MFYVYTCIFLRELCTVRSLTGGFVCWWDLPFVLFGNCWFIKPEERQQPTKEILGYSGEYLEKFSSYLIWNTAETGHSTDT